MATQYAPLFALETQFQTKDGRNNTGGWLKVFLAATDDPATTYSDYNYTRNPEKIILDDDGRATVICDKSKAYRLEVYDISGMLLWTEEPVYCSGTGGGGISITKVISTDGSIAIDESVVGSTTTYDIGLAPRDNDEFLEWIKCSEEDCGSTWYPEYQYGTMETEAGQGIKVHKGQLYHFTNSFFVDPDGTGITYDTFKVLMYCNDEIVDSRDFDIDTSVNDAVQCEFSTDVIPADDGFVYFKLTIPSTCEVSGEIQAHRIYSGINAVPDTCATKQWVQETFDFNLSSKVDYSAIEYNGYGQISGISGSAIAGGMDSATVSSIASSVASAYTESAFSSISSWTAEFSSISSKADQSSLSAYQPVSAMSGYATEAYVDARVGEKLDVTASSLFLTSLPDDLATTGDVASAVSGKMDKTEGSAFYPMTGNPSGFLTAHQSLAGYATEQYVDSAVSSKLDTSAFASASAGFQPSGDYAFNSSLSTYIPTSASGAFAPSGNYVYASSLSSKMDVTASSLFVQNSAYTAYTANMGDVVNNISSSINSMSADVTGKQDTSAMTAWIPYSALDYSGTAISGIGGSSLAGMGGGDYTGIYPVNVDNTAREISVDSLPLVTDSSMTSYASGDSSVIGVNMDILSGKLDSSAQVVTATATQLYAGTAYLTRVNGAPISAERAGNAANASFATSAYYDGTGRLISALPDSAAVSAIASAYQVVSSTASGYHADYGENMVNGINGLSISATVAYESMYAGTAAVATMDRSNRLISALPDSATVSAIASAYTTGKQDTLTFGYDDNKISAINGSAIGGQGGVDSATVSAIASGYAESAASGKLDTTAFNSGDFYSTANPSGFITGVDLSNYATTGYVDSSVSSKLDSTAFNSGDFYSTSNPSGFITGVDLTPYQTTADMSSYISTSMSSDFQQVTGMSSYALSSDVSGTVDLVSTQSANWGGSALQLSAGPGVKLEKVGDTLVASTDRELLWSGSATGNYTAQLSEPKTNFEKVEIWHTWNPSVQGGPYVTTYGSDFERAGCMGGGCTTNADAPFSFLTVFSANNTGVTILSAGQGQGATPNDFNSVYKCLLRVYGVNRTAGA